MAAKDPRVYANLSNADGTAAFLRQVPETDILVNHMGVFEPKSFEEISDGDWMRLFETNLLSTLGRLDHVPSVRTRPASGITS